MIRNPIIKKIYKKGDCCIRDRKCQACVKLIKPFNLSANRKFCSLECKYNASRLSKKIINRKCLICGNIIPPFSEKKDKKYCSKKCMSVSQGWHVSKSNINCKYCGNIFEGRNWCIINSNKRYCSQECHYNDKKIRKCISCSDELILDISKFHNGFCQRCYNCYSTLKQVLNKKGVNNSGKFIRSKPELVFAYRIYMDTRKEKINEFGCHK